VVIELNQQAYDQMKCTKELVIVPGATHLFEEPAPWKKSHGSPPRGSHDI